MFHYPPGRFHNSFTLGVFQEIFQPKTKPSKFVRKIKAKELKEVGKIERERYKPRGCE